MEIRPEDERRVAVAIPAGDQVQTDFALSLASMLNHTAADPPPGLTTTGLFCVRMTVLPNARNLLTQQALEANATHILWIDSDMIFPPDMLRRLLAHRVPVVGINAMMRRPPYQLTAEVKAGEKLVTTGDSTGLEKVYRLGLGVLMIETDAIRKIKRRPWFDFEWVGNKHVHRGEDYVFCSKLRKAGFDLWVDQDLSKEVGHVGQFCFRPGMGEGGS